MCTYHWKRKLKWRSRPGNTSMTKHLNVTLSLNEVSILLTTSTPLSLPPAISPNTSSFSVWRMSPGQFPPFTRKKVISCFNYPQKIVYNGNEVGDEFVKTEYYKDLNCVDKQHHTTGTGFIRVADTNGRNFSLEPDSVTSCHSSCKGNPATNDWIPAAPDAVNTKINIIYFILCNMICLNFCLHFPDLFGFR
ncbi:uncharacterized protein LOC120159946 [Hibiscus syriacus]|uniref:uncharacterized protein LOC120159946 n=1 Tax=Hibiscus syriacus TaxID=106335 RepID=UPI001924C370|nr:uncharacterized protein LOC120159946 [Hibiscus syriacus]